jgi:TPR repeat protein
MLWQYQFTNKQWQAQGGKRKCISCVSGGSVAKAASPAVCNKATGKLKLAYFAARRAAEEGNKKAQHKLGTMYKNGNDAVKRDSKQAFKWYQFSAEQGYDLAQHALGAQYYQGDGIPQNMPAAAIWLEKAAEQGHSNAQYNVGTMFYDGKGVRQDWEIAELWFRRSAEQGDMRAQYNLGIMLGRGEGGPEQIKQAEMWVKLAAMQGHMEAKLLLGLNPDLGQLSDESAVPEADSRHIAKLAAWQRQISTLVPIQVYMTGCSLYFGIDRVIDRENAAACFRQAAEVGHGPSVVFLGMCSYFGHGVPKDEEEAQRCFAKAVHQCKVLNSIAAEDVMGILSVAYMKYYGWGCKTADRPGAAVLFEVAAQMKSSAAEYMFGAMGEK